MADVSEQQELVQNLESAISAMAKKKDVFQSKMFDGDRDMYETLGYDPSPDFKDYYRKWRRSGIGKAIISKAPDATWKDDPIIESEQEDSKLQEQVKIINDNAKLWMKTHKGDKLAGIGKWGAILIGVEEQGVSINWESEMNPINGPESIKYLRVMKQNTITDYKEINDKSDPRNGLPKTYLIDLPEKNKVQEVHHSRIIWIAENTEEDLLQGTPRLESSMNRFYDLQKVVGGSAEAFWSLADAGYKAIGAQDADIDWNQINENIQGFSHDLVKFFSAQGLDEFEKMETTPPDPSNFWTVLIQYIAASADPPIPMRILIGNESGELASTTDQETWFGNITQRRNKYVTTQIVRPIIDRFMEYGIIEEQEYNVRWPTLFEKDIQEKMKIAKTAAEAMQTFNKARALGETAVTIEEFRTEYMDMPEERNQNLQNVENSLNYSNQQVLKMVKNEIRKLKEE